MDLFEKSNAIQKEAQQILQTLDLKPLLSKYGEFKIVGSMSYKLMTWRDIDMDVVFDHDPTDTEFWEILQELFKNKKIRLFMFVDDREIVTRNRPKSMYIGLKYEDDKKEIWKIDIRLINKKYVATDEIEKLINAKLTPEKKQIILEIKSAVDDNPKYHKDFQSVDIYQAVLENEVRDLQHFQEYLQKIGKSY